MIAEDHKVPFPAFFVRHKNKTEQRRFIATQSLQWLKFQHERGCLGAIMVDIDDTLIDYNECVNNGFQYMKDLYRDAAVMFPLHIVTARPDEDHHSVMKMLATRGFSIPPDRLHMLPTHLYGKDYSHVERFKWETFLKIGKLHNGVVARFGDKMWDVAHIRDLSDSYRGSSQFSHVSDRDCYIFMDPSMKGTVSFKLPGT